MVTELSALRVAWLMPDIFPYRVKMMESVAERVGRLRIFIGQNRQRKWNPDWKGLDVCELHEIKLRREYPHPGGFIDKNSLRVPFDAGRRLSDFNPHVVVSFELGPRTLAAMLWRKRHPKSLLIVDLHMSERTEERRGRGARRFLRRWLLNNADGVFVNGSSCTRYIKSLDIRQTEIFPLTQVTDPTSFLQIEPRRRAAEAAQLLFVGQLIERKGLEPFLYALAHWAKRHPERNIDFRIVGDGPLAGRLREFAAPANLRVHLEGFVQYDDLDDFYAAADVFAFPTLADEWGLVVNESLAAGLPVLGSNFSQAVEEIIEPGVTGWQFAPDSFDETLAAIEAFMNTSEAELLAMQERCREVGRHLTPELAADQALAAISSLMSRSSA